MFEATTCGWRVRSRYPIELALVLAPQGSRAQDVSSAARSPDDDKSWCIIWSVCFSPCVVRIFPLVCRVMRGKGMNVPSPCQTMSESLVARKRSIQSKPKVKTGCATCRSVSHPSPVCTLGTENAGGSSVPRQSYSLSNRRRKVKCDENKPFCHKCVGTGRTCDGYESPFRFFNSQPIADADAGGAESDLGLQNGAIRPALPEIAALDVDLLSRYFSTKTMFDVNLGCDEEARQVLQASLTDPTIRHAVSSLKALREDLEASRDIQAAAAQRIPSHEYGLEQYCMALGGLASNLSSEGSNGLKSALLCCQIFISIEQVRGNFAAMAQHVTQGLRIMRENGARPSLDAANKLLPARHGQIPFLDVFIIKLFTAPCRFAGPPAIVDKSGTTASVCLISPYRQPAESRDLRTIAPNMRTELTRIAASALEFLGKVSQVETAETALQLLSEKASLLDSLGSWLKDLEVARVEETRSPDHEPLSVSFMRLFHQTLKIVLLGALDASPELGAELRTENERLQSLAGSVGEKVKTHGMSGGN